jgi:hypothetical protein
MRVSFEADGSGGERSAAREPVILVVGAGDATGGAIAKKFASEGYTACLVRRQASKMDQLVQDIVDKGGKAHAFGVDARSEGTVTDSPNCLSDGYQMLCFGIFLTHRSKAGFGCRPDGGTRGAHRKRHRRNQSAGIQHRCQRQLPHPGNNSQSLPQGMHFLN